MATKLPRLNKEALEFCEDTYWARKASLRERTFNRKKAISHKKVWAAG